MKKSYKLIGISVLLAASALFLIYSYISSGKDQLIKNDNDDMYEETVESDAPAETKEIVVEIKGAVKNPNVYWLAEDSIVEDLISKAGGLTESADTASVNRAEKLKSHELITIPDKNNNQKTNENNNQNVNILGSEKDSLSSKLVNINTADEKELDSLPGIGPSKAKDIVSYREQNGEFKSIDDIKNVKGIGDSCFEKLKDKITV